CQSGPIPESPGETWRAVEAALHNGGRGFKGGSSLAQFLSERREVRIHHHPPPLSIRQILAWADPFHARVGGWPKGHSGPVPEAPGETWQAVHDALYIGLRGFSGGSSLARLLARSRAVRNIHGLPPLSIAKILRWAKAHQRRTGTFPTRSSGPVL